MSNILRKLVVAGRVDAAVVAGRVDAAPVAQRITVT
jgi:hypothetical protein